MNHNIGHEQISSSKTSTRKFLIARSLPMCSFDKSQPRKKMKRKTKAATTKKKMTTMGTKATRSSGSGDHTFNFQYPLNGVRCTFCSFSSRFRLWQLYRDASEAVVRKSLRVRALSTEKAGRLSPDSWAGLSRLAEGFDGFPLGVVYVEDRDQLGNLQQITHVLGQARQLDRATRVLRACAQVHERV